MGPRGKVVVVLAAASHPSTTSPFPGRAVSLCLPLAPPRAHFLLVLKCPGRWHHQGAKRQLLQAEA